MRKLFLLGLAATVAVAPGNAQRPDRLGTRFPPSAVWRPEDPWLGSRMDYRTSVVTAKATTPSQARFCCDHEHVGVTALELLMLQVLPWYFNRHVGDDSTAIISPATWKSNLEQGFEWDPNGFTTNMFMHPYHGNTYFNAARTNGYDYWESVAFAWLGSLLWEFLGENNRAAVNDWVNTSLGGIMIGEASYRASTLLLDNARTGWSRAWRELAAFAVNPIGGGNRLFRGEMSRVGVNPTYRAQYRAPIGLTVRVGRRAIVGGFAEGGRSGGFAEFDLRYGDPFRPTQSPFDAFQVTGQMNTNDGQGRLQIEGTLLSTALSTGDRHAVTFAVNQHYDYVNTDAYEVGGQSVSATLLARRSLGDGVAIGGKIQPSAAAIAAVSSEYADQTGRDYDFGSGLGIRAFGALSKGRREMLSLFYVFFWTHSLNGAAGNHFIQFLGVRLEGPSSGRLGVGVEFIDAVRNSRYTDFPAVNRANRQLRLFLTWYPNREG